MLNNDFEKYIKNNLESARLDWDKEEMWSEIETQLPKNEKPERGILFWLVASLTLVMLLGAGLFFMTKTTKATTSKNEHAEIISQIKVNASKVNAQSLTDIKLISELNNVELIETKNQVTLAKDSVNNYKSKAIQNENITIGKPANILTSRLVNISSNDKEYAKKDVVKSVLKSSPELGGNLTINNNIELGKSPLDKRSELEKMIDAHNASVLNARQVNLSLLDRLNHYVINTDAREFGFTFDNKSTLITPKNNFRAAELFAFAHYSLLNRTLTDLGDNNTLFQARQESEMTLEGLGAQLGYRHFFSPSIYVEAIVEYRRINEVLNFNQKEVDQIVVDSDTANYYVSFTGETKYVRGENVIDKITTTPFVKYNEHHFISLPIHIGYRKSYKQFDFDFLIGPVLNVYQSYSGDIINDNLLVKEDHSPDKFNGKLLAGVDVGINANYNLVNGFALTSGLGYRKSISNYSIDGLLGQSYNSLDFKLGVLLKI